MTVEEAQAQHGMFFHLWTLAHNCGIANEGDWARRRAAFEVRDYCTNRMRETFAEFAAEFEPPKKAECDRIGGCLLGVGCGHCKCTTGASA